jgi:hypothetical protein
MMAWVIAHIDAMDRGLGEQVSQIRKGMGNGMMVGKGTGAVFAVAKDAEGKAVRGRIASVPL